MEQSNKVSNKTKMFYYKILFFTISALVFLTLLVGIIIFAIKVSNTSYKKEQDFDINYSKFFTLSQPETNDYRLPRDLVPIYYDIKISTNFHDDIEPKDFNGTVKINFLCKNSTDKIILHAKNLLIKNISINIDDLVSIKYLQIFYENDKQLLIIQLFDRLILNNHYSVVIEYQGFLLNDNTGLYRASYLDSQNNKR